MAGLFVVSHTLSLSFAFAVMKFSSRISPLAAGKGEGE
jgi:hypothetical protein